MQVTICGQTFDIEKETKIIDKLNFTHFKTKIDDKTFLFRTYYEDRMIKTCEIYDGITIEDIIKNEIRLELYSIIRDVNLADISSGKRLDLLPEFIQEFGVEWVNLEVQDLHSELVMEAMRHYGGE